MFCPAGKSALCVTTVLFCSALATGALADTSDAQKAEELFRSAKPLLADEDFEHACPLLAKSFELDPATGTLVALAFCHEREGKLGSAYREYDGVIARGRTEARPDRVRFAREHAAAIETRLSTLTLKASNVSAIPELEVKIDGAPIGRDRLDRKFAVDGGDHRIEVSAQGKKPWRAELRFAKSFDARTVEIPALADVAATPSVNAVPPARRPRAARLRPSAVARESRPAPTSGAPSRVDQPSGLAPVQWVGIVSMGTGLVGVGIGTMFAATAISRNGDSSNGCIGDVCSAEARQQRLDARSAGKAATISFIAGGTLAVTGVAMYLLGQRSRPSSARERAALSAAPWATSDGLGGVVQGSL